MAYTQDERICQVSSPLGENVLLLSSMSARESISNPFFFDMQFVSESEDIDFAAIVGKQLSVHLQLANGNGRYFNGIVSRFSQGQAEGGFASYRAEVVPWISLLRRRAGCRIFQHKTVPDIIKALLAETDFGDVEFQLSGDFPEREYCVQYRETDFHFISRLAEEEGIAYFFKHSDKQHTLVLFNSPSAAAPCPGQTSVAYASAVDLSVLAGSISEWSVEHELATGKYSLTDYNFEDPSMSLLTTTSSSTTLGGNEKFEIYDHPGEYLQLSEGERRVKLRMQAEEAAAIHIYAQSDCAAFVPGFRFDLQGHFRPSYNTSYLITEVSHVVSQGVGVGEGNGQSSYANTLSCIPHSVPFRPQQLTAKPLITGVQTATVVGASGKEIDVDAHGRVVVQFHWDREGKKDENSSCRVRVSQNWAGKNWGFIANPRIGQEVIVEFIEGDPDRPIVTGRVYNGEQTVPYALPANSTQTGIKSRSSMEGAAANFNEIRLEDKKGEEQLFIHAEKNWDSEVENDQTHSVGRNQTITVTKDRTKTVSGNQIEKVEKNKDISVGGDHSEKIEGNQGVGVTKNASWSAGGDGSIDFTGKGTVTIGKSLSESVGEKLDYSVGDAATLSITKDWTISVGKKLTSTVADEMSLSVEKDSITTIGGAEKVTTTKSYDHQAEEMVFEASKKITIKAGDAVITLDGNSGEISIKGAKIGLKADDSIVMTASKITQN